MGSPVRDGLYRARRVLTMDRNRPVVDDAGIVVRDGRIAALDSFSVLRGEELVHDYGPAVLCPGLINAHAHLGLSCLGGRVPQGLGFAAWADRLFSLMGEPLSVPELTRTVAGMRDAGVVCVADIVGRDGEWIQKIVEDAGLGALFFREISGRGRGTGKDVVMPDQWSLAVHALYSTDGECARRVKAECRKRNAPFSMHLAEVPGENDLLSSGRGELADFLRARRILPRNFAAPGRSAVRFAADLGLLDACTLAVHCVHVADRDLSILAESGATICLCPRSNAWIGVGVAPAQKFWAHNIPLCLGTDSLASNTDLNLWAEVHAVRRLLPATVSLWDLLALVTINPARVLGLDHEYGLLAAGRPARWSVLPPEYAQMSPADF